MKSHQIYQDLILLKHHLRDILTPLVNNTNLDSRQNQRPQDEEQMIQHQVLDRTVDSHFSHRCNLDCNDKLIELIIEAPELIGALKQIAKVLRPLNDVQFYTDGSLQ